MSTPYQPNAADALYDQFTGVTFIDRVVYALFRPRRVDARFFLKPIQDEVLNLIRVTQHGPNQLLNSSFALAQRQIPATPTIVAANAYGPDRWKLTAETTALTYARIANASEAALSAAWYGQLAKVNDGKVLACQILTADTTRALRGRSMHLQLKLKASAAMNLRIGVLQLAAAGTPDTIPNPLVTGWNTNHVDPTLATNIAIVAAGTCAATTAWQAFSLDLTVPADCQNLICAVWSDDQIPDGASLSIAEADFYIGAGARRWTPPTRAAELVACQEFFETSFDADIAAADFSGDFNGTACYACQFTGPLTVVPFALTIPFKRAKFKTPAMTAYNPEAAMVTAGAWRNDTGSDSGVATFPTIGQASFTIRDPGNAANVAGDLIFAHWSADAEL